MRPQERGFQSKYVHGQNVRDLGILVIRGIFIDLCKYFCLFYVLIFIDK